MSFFDKKQTCLPVAANQARQQMQAGQQQSIGVAVQQAGMLGQGLTTSGVVPLQAQNKISYDVPIEIEDGEITGNLVSLWSLTHDAHPSVGEDLITLLLNMADSKHITDRLAAVRHVKTPTAKIVMMQNDDEDEIRDAVNKRIKWETENE